MPDSINCSKIAEQQRRVYPFCRRHFGQYFDIISTRNIFVRPWGKYPTLIGPTFSNYTFRAYVSIICQKGFNQRCDHERLHLKWVERKRVAFERHLVRVRQDMSDDVTANYAFPSLNDALGMASPIIARGTPCPMKSNSVTTGSMLVDPLYG